MSALREGALATVSVAVELKEVVVLETAQRMALEGVLEEALEVVAPQAVHVG